MFQFSWILLISATVCAAVRYDNYKVYRVTPKIEDHMLALRDVYLSEEYVFWTQLTKTNNSVDVLVAPHQIDSFEFLTDGMKREILNHNVQHTIDKQKRQIIHSEQFNFNEYHSLGVVSSNYLITVTVPT